MKISGTFSFQSTLEVFLELEHMDLINETNLGLLESIIQPVCPVLMDKILKFKAEYSKPLEIHIANITHKNVSHKSHF